MKRRNRITFISRLYYPDHSAGSQMLTDLSFFLADAGFDISVIASRALYENSSSTLEKNELINGVNITRVFSTLFGRKNLPGRLIDYMSFNISCLWTLLLSTRRGDCIAFMTDPPLLSAIAYPIVLLRGGVLVNWIHDIFPETATRVGIFGLRGFIGDMLSALRNKSLKSAVMNIVISERMQQYIAQQGISEDRMLIIPNWADSRDISVHHPESDLIRTEWGLNDKFVVGYSGNLGMAHDIDTIIGAADRLRDDTNTVFLFTGGGSGLKILKKKAEDRAIRNIVFKPYQPRERLGAVLGVSDVHWLTLKPELEGLVFPSKFYGILASGRPAIFIGSDNGELSEEIRRVGCGEVVGIGKSDRLVEIIKSLRNRPDRIQEMGLLGRAQFDKEYDFRISAEKFRKFFETLPHPN